jgi:hypothetical protein
VTSKTKLAADEAIAVPELWIFDSGKLALYTLIAGKYESSETSPLFPRLRSSNGFQRSSSGLGK